MPEKQSSGFWGCLGVGTALVLLAVVVFFGLFIGLCGIARR